MSNDRFKIETDDFLGYKFEEFKNDQYSTALATPSVYFTLRKEVLKQVKNDAVSEMYITFYNLLSKGKAKDGSDIGTTKVLEPPCYPQQLVSKFALKAAATMEKIIDEALDIILPIDIKHLATKRIEDQSKQNF